MLRSIYTTATGTIGGKNGLNQFRIRQFVKLAELDEEFVNGVIVGMPTKRWPYYEVCFQRWNGSFENMWLTDTEMISAEAEPELSLVKQAAICRRC